MLNLQEKWSSSKSTWGRTRWITMCRWSDGFFACNWLEEQTTIIEGILNEKSLGGNGNNNILPQFQCSNLSHTNFSNNNDNNSDWPYEVVPKQEALIVENGNKFYSLKRNFPLAYGHDETHPTKRSNNMHNNYNYNVNNHLLTFLNSMQPNQRFQQ